MKDLDIGDIQEWSWNRKGGYGTVYDAAKHFKVPAKTIVDIVKDNSYYFYILGDGPDAKEMHFDHDGE